MSARGAATRSWTTSRPAGVARRSSMISQIKVDIRGISDAEKIAQKVFDAECELYPRTLDQLIKGNSFLNGPEIFIAEDL